jgi:hypothetical protein
MTQIKIRYNSVSEHLITLCHWLYNHIIQACIRIEISEKMLTWLLITCLSVQHLNNIYLLYKVLQHLFMFIDFGIESYINRRGRRGSGCMVVAFKLPMQSMPITTNFVSSNPAQVKCT